MTYEEQKEKDQPTVDAWNDALRKEIAAKEREFDEENRKNRYE